MNLVDEITSLLQDAGLRDQLTDEGFRKYTDIRSKVADLEDINRGLEKKNKELEKKNKELESRESRANTAIADTKRMKEELDEKALTLKVQEAEWRGHLKVLEEMKWMWSIVFRNTEIRQSMVGSTPSRHSNAAYDTVSVNKEITTKNE